ncbi:MAG: M16 family metallopeptidase, partial [Bacteroidota bacterium]
PGLKMSEKMLELAYPVHSYGHTTIGYYQDVLDMPNHYDAAVKFYQAYYRPNNCVLVITGDVDTNELLPKIRRHYGTWQSLPTPDVTVEDPPQKEERRGHVPWESDVPPRVSVAYKLSGHRTGSAETAVGQVLPELLASESAPLFRKLRYEKKTASEFYFDGGKATYEGFDPRLVAATARLFKEQYSEKGKQYMEEVIQDIIAGFDGLKNFSAMPEAANILETVKSKYRYDFLASLDSPASVAQILAWYYRFERDPNVLDKLVASVDKLQPMDIDMFATNFFVSNNRVIVTMSHEPEQ